MDRRRVVLIGLAAIAIISIAFWVLRTEETSDIVPIVGVVVAADSEFDPCLECHDDLDASILGGTVSIIGFTHQEHFSNSGDVGCGNCHGTDTHDRTPPRTPEMDDCFACHVDDGPAPELPCLRCHDAVTVPPPQSHFTTDWSALHSSAAQLNQSLCETCHSRELFCTACHGTEIPHPDAWAGYPHARAMFDSGIESCSQCHTRGPELTARDDCDRCHHPQNQNVPVWRDAHPEVVRSEGGTACFECHDPDTCSTCHTQGVEDFTADLRRLIEPGGSDE